MREALLIGAGSIARRHAESLHQIVPEISLTVLRRSGELPAFCDGMDARICDSLDAALRRSLDVAVIATPSATHADTLIPLIEEGIPVYVEKPLVVTRSQLENVTDALRAGYAGPSMVGCNLRHLPSLILLKDVLESGRLGNVVRASFEAGQWLPDWRPERDYRSSYSADADLGGGVLFDLIHEVDAARWLLGEFEEIVAWTGRFSRLELRSEDTACLMMAGEEGAPFVSIGLDYVSRMPVRRYTFVGEEGTADWNLMERRLVIRLPGGPEVLTSRDEDFDVSATYRRGMEEFLHSVASGHETSQPLQEGIRTVEVVLNARESGLHWH